MGRHHIRELLAFVAGIYALVYAVVLVATVGDTDRRLNVAAWFSWHPALLVVLASGVGAEVLSSIAHFLGTLAATLQSLGFFIWAVVLWSREPAGNGSPLQDGANFLGLMAGALAAQTFVGIVLFLLSIRNMLVVRGQRGRQD